MITGKSLAWAFLARKIIFGWTQNVWLSAHGHPAMSCGFSVPKEVVFSEQRHLGENKSVRRQSFQPRTAFGAMKRRRVSRTAGHNGFLAACGHGEISIAGSSTSSRETRETLLKCNRLFASTFRTQVRLLTPTSLKRTGCESSEKSKEWPAGVLAFLDALRQQHPERAPTPT